MISLHFPTLNLFMIVLLLSAALIFALVARHYRRRAGPWWWLAGCLLIAVGYFIRFWFANTAQAETFWAAGGLFIAGNAAFWIGLYQFCGVRRSWRPRPVALMLLLAWLVAVWLPYGLQVATMLLVVGVINWLAFLAIRRAHHLGNTAMLLFVGAVFLTTAIIMWLRMLAHLGAWWWHWSISVEQLGAWGLVASSALMMLRCFALLLLLHARQEHDLQYLAITDPLTGVLNRKGFLEQAQRLLERQQPGDRPVAVLMMDLDHFKRINDQHGHAAGDAVLRRFANILREQLRPGDCTGRLGGEEFAALLPGVDGETALHVAERLRSHLDTQAIATAAGLVNVSVSIGVQSSLRPPLSIEWLLQQADQALYQAKHKGRNQVVSLAADADSGPSAPAQ
ncbi:GGDEF domain-containing protein [Permianibacter sp. IMCC34836]|uniref:GGDEF domain-containing protein n=1 Tax=Permianibacter fluminis TaxID=2738515 RepID=UPI001555A3D7|nr:GGDEF domain-containing protein [Permianibacter fluminis]NQD36175.1 GGDEF domain-containing protein [Permianibacter fluminis]